MGIRPDTLIHAACVTFTTGVDCERGGSMHVGREVSSHLHGERSERFGRSTRHHTGLITIPQRLFLAHVVCSIPDTANACTAGSSNLPF